ncbi:MAG: hypothetical protein IKA98_01240, partial [Candidatus Methanomethylophilaceae archaeon]|nr:hypothetical protein [Candidatus Methanomethylophilaceae archaeon]
TPGIFTSGWTTKMGGAAAHYGSYFTSADSGYIVQKDDSGELKEESLSYTVFEKYGVILLPLALLMFGAMVGGVCISREEVESDDSN